MKFTLDSFDDPDQLLAAAARLTLRLLRAIGGQGTLIKRNPARQHRGRIVDVQQFVNC